MTRRLDVWVPAAGGVLAIALAAGVLIRPGADQPNLLLVGPLVHDFGIVPVGRDIASASHVFVLRNLSDEPVRIEKLSTTCGCTEASIDPDVVPPGGALIQWSWFRHYPAAPAPQSQDRIVQSWDTASKAEELSDYSACTTWLVRGGDYYLVDVLRARLEYPDLRRRIIAHAETHGAKTVLIEDAGSGTHLIQELQREGGLRPIAIKPEGDKITRMAAQTATIEAGHVLLPENASWLGDFQTEIMAFPFGRFDDQVDSVSQFLKWAEARRSSYRPVSPVSITRPSPRLTC